MVLVGLAVTPADAHPIAKSKAHLVTLRNGGNGAVREVLDAILESRTPRDS
jgi:3-deoxy-D-manno-octulosonate 8-phosphate phosphatase (KDO 8-P phosphatase)